MEKKSIAKVRSAYAKQIEKTVRGFNSYLREIIADFDAVNIDATKAAAKAAADEAKAAADAARAAARAASTDASKQADADAAKQKSEAAKQRSDAAAKRASAAAARAADAASKQQRDDLREICAAYGLQRDDLQLSFLRSYLFCADSNGKICDAKRVKLEDEDEARKTFDGYEFKRNEDGILFYLKPCEIWTASKLLQKFAAAARTRKAIAAQADAATREADAAKRAAARIDAMRKQIAEYDAKHASEADAASEADEAKASEAQTK